MDSANSMRPPVAQPQSSEGRQRKRPRIPTQSLSMSSQESDMVNSSHHMEVGSTSHGSWQCISIAQAPSQATPPIPETVQRRRYPNRQQKQKKKNTKSFQEFVLNMHKQNCVFMEKKLVLMEKKLVFMKEKQVFMKKKLEVQRAHHDEELQILRERSKNSKKLFALQSLRLDLEFMRMEQQREDSRIRELASLVELEKLHGNS